MALSQVQLDWIVSKTFDITETYFSDRQDKDFAINSFIADIKSFASSNVLSEKEVMTVVSSYLCLEKMHQDSEVEDAKCAMQFLEEQKKLEQSTVVKNVVNNPIDNDVEDKIIVLQSKILKNIKALSNTRSLNEIKATKLQSSVYKYIARLDEIIKNEPNRINVIKDKILQESLSLLPKKIKKAYNNLHIESKKAIKNPVYIQNNDNYKNMLCSHLNNVISIFPALNIANERNTILDVSAKSFTGAIRTMTRSIQSMMQHCPLENKYLLDMLLNSLKNIQSADSAEDRMQNFINFTSVCGKITIHIALANIESEKNNRKANQNALIQKAKILSRNENQLYLLNEKILRNDKVVRNFQRLKRNAINSDNKKLYDRANKCFSNLHDDNSSRYIELIENAKIHNTQFNQEPLKTKLLNMPFVATEESSQKQIFQGYYDIIRKHIVASVGDTNRTKDNLNDNTWKNLLPNMRKRNKRVVAIVYNSNTLIRRLESKIKKGSPISHEEIKRLKSLEHSAKKLQQMIESTDKIDQRNSNNMKDLINTHLQKNQITKYDNDDNGNKELILFEGLADSIAEDNAKMVRKLNNVVESINASIQKVNKMPPVFKFHNIKDNSLEKNTEMRVGLPDIVIDNNFIEWLHNIVKTRFGESIDVKNLLGQCMLHDFSLNKNDSNMQRARHDFRLQKRNLEKLIMRDSTLADDDIKTEDVIKSFLLSALSLPRCYNKVIQKSKIFVSDDTNETVVSDDIFSQSIEFHSKQSASIGQVRDKINLRNKHSPLPNFNQALDLLTNYGKMDEFLSIFSIYHKDLSDTTKFQMNKAYLSYQKKLENSNVEFDNDMVYKNTNESYKEIFQLSHRMQIQIYGKTFGSLIGGVIAGYSLWNLLNGGINIQKGRIPRNRELYAGLIELLKKVLAESGASVPDGFDLESTISNAQNINDLITSLESALEATDLSWVEENQEFVDALKSMLEQFQKLGEILGPDFDSKEFANQVIRIVILVISKTILLRIIPSIIVNICSLRLKAKFYSTIGKQIRYNNNANLVMDKILFNSQKRLKSIYDQIYNQDEYDAVRKAGGVEYRFTRNANVDEHMILKSEKLTLKRMRRLMLSVYDDNNQDAKEIEKIEAIKNIFTQVDLLEDKYIKDESLSVEDQRSAIQEQIFYTSENLFEKYAFDIMSGISINNDINFTKVPHSPLDIVQTYCNINISDMLEQDLLDAMQINIKKPFLNVIDDGKSYKQQLLREDVVARDSRLKHALLRTRIVNKFTPKQTWRYGHNSIFDASQVRFDTEDYAFAKMHNDYTDALEDLQREVLYAVIVARRMHENAKLIEDRRKLTMEIIQLTKTIDALSFKKDKNDTLSAVPSNYDTLKYLKKQLHKKNETLLKLDIVIKGHIRFFGEKCNIKQNITEDSNCATINFALMSKLQDYVKHMNESIREKSNTMSLRLQELTNAGYSVKVHHVQRMNSTQNKSVLMDREERMHETKQNKKMLLAKKIPITKRKHMPEFDNTNSAMLTGTKDPKIKGASAIITREHRFPQDEYINDTTTVINIKKQENLLNSRKISNAKKKTNQSFEKHMINSANRMYAKNVSDFSYI